VRLRQPRYNFSGAWVIEELASDSNDIARGGILVNDDIIPKETVSQLNFFLRE